MLAVCITSPILFCAGYVTHRWLTRRSRPATELVPGSAVQDATQVSQQLHAAVLRLEEELSLYRDRFEAQRDRSPQDTAHAPPPQELLDQTQVLVEQLTSSRLELHDHIRRLINAADTRFDPETGLGSQREANRWMENLLAIMARYGNAFSIAIVTVDRAKGQSIAESETSGCLNELGRLLRQQIRETDVLARYSEDELLVILPETNEAGALVMAQRARGKAAADLQFNISIGVAGAMPGDSYKSLIHRADAALFAAQDAEGCTVGCQQNGLDMRVVQADGTATDVHADQALASAN